MERKIQTLEERFAHLERVVEDLSDEVARQATALRRAEHRVASLLQREAERETAEGGGVPLADRRPPHW
ncbi:MAG: SlyX family protein [Pseudomonadota bacterium]